MSEHVLTLLPSGETSTEALRAQPLNWSSQARQIHQSTLALKLGVLTLGKVLSHVTAARFPTLSQTKTHNLLVHVFPRPYVDFRDVARKVCAVLRLRWCW